MHFKMSSGICFSLDLSKILWSVNRLMDRKHVEKQKLLVRVISPFPTVFSKDLYCRQVKTRACFGKG